MGSIKTPHAKCERKREIESENEKKEDISNVELGYSLASIYGLLSRYNQFKNFENKRNIFLFDMLSKYKHFATAQ